MHPILLQSKYFTLHSFWVFFGIALFIGTYLILQLSKRNNLKIQFLSENSINLILSAIIGARIVAIIANYQTYFYELSPNSLLNLLYIWDKGMDGWGAVAGFLITLFILCRKKEQSFLRWLDVLVPSIITMIAIISLGSFFDGLSYGKETSLPWGVNFESPSIKYTVPIHPTQIYAFIYSTIIAIILILIDPIKIKEKKQEGLIGLFGIMAFCLFKVLEEFLRGDDAILLMGIRIPQILSFLILIMTGIFIIYHYNDLIKKFKHKKK